MPNKTTHLVLFLLNCAFGAFWGAVAIILLIKWSNPFLAFCFPVIALWILLSLFPFIRMNRAIRSGDEAAAMVNAKKLITLFWIGVAVSVMVIFSLIMFMKVPVTNT